MSLAHVQLIVYLPPDCAALFFLPLCWRKRKYNWRDELKGTPAYCEREPEEPLPGGRLAFSLESW